MIRTNTGCEGNTEEAAQDVVSVTEKSVVEVVHILLEGMIETLHW